MYFKFWVSFGTFEFRGENMVKLNEVYKCNICGNIVEVVHASRGQLVCCGQPMKLLEAKTEDVGKEKHLPVVEVGNKIVVKIGEVPHPMEENHYIEWIEVVAGDKVYRKYLKPGDEAKAEFEVVGEKFAVREYCNIHGLWIKEV